MRRKEKVCFFIVDYYLFYSIVIIANVSSFYNIMTIVFKVKLELQ